MPAVQGGRAGVSLVGRQGSWKEQRGHRLEQLAPSYQTNGKRHGISVLSRRSCSSFGCVRSWLGPFPPSIPLL